MAYNSDNETISWFYDTLTKKGVNLGTKDQFSNALANDEETRKWLYETGKKHQIPMGTYEQFSTAIGPYTPNETKTTQTHDNVAPPTLLDRDFVAEETEVNTPIYTPNFQTEEAEAVAEQYELDRDALKSYVPEFKSEIKKKYPYARLSGFTRPVQMGGPGMSYVGEEAFLTIEDRQRKGALDEQLKLGQINKAQYESEVKAINQQAVDRYNEQYSEETINASAALHLMTKAQNRIKTVESRTNRRVGNFFRGLKYADYAGVSPAMQLVDAYASFALLNKLAEDPEVELTESEEYLLQAIVTNNAVDDTFQTNMAERIGVGLPTNLAYMAQFALTGGVGSAASTAAKKGAKWVIKKGMKNAERKLYAKGFKGLLQKGVDRTLNTVIPGAVGAVTAATAQTALDPAGVAADTMNRMAGTPEYTMDGGIPVATGEVSGRQEFGEAFKDAFVAKWAENLSERSGESLGVILGAGKAVGKTVGKAAVENLDAVRKAADKLSDLTTSVRNTKIGGLVSQAASWIENQDLGLAQVATAVGWNGTVEEFYEEQVNTILNAWLVGDEDLSSLLNSERQLETLLSVGVVGGAMRLINSPVALAQRADVRREKQNIKRSITNIEKAHSTQSERDALAAIAKVVDNGTVTDVASTLAELNRQGHLDSQTAQDFLNYATGRIMLNMWRSNDQRQASKITSEILAEAKARTHKQSGTIVVAEYTDARGNTQKVDIIDGVIIRDADRIDSTLSDRSVIIRKQDGTTEMVSSKQLGNVVEEISPEVYQNNLLREKASTLATNFATEYNSRMNRHGVHYNEDGTPDYYNAQPSQIALSLIDERGNIEEALAYAQQNATGLQQAAITSAEGGDGLTIEAYNMASKWNAVADLLDQMSAQAAMNGGVVTPEIVANVDDVAAVGNNLRPGDRVRLTVDNGEIVDATIGARTPEGRLIVDFDEVVTVGGNKGQSLELTPEVVSAMTFVEEMQEGEEVLDAEENPEQDDVTTNADFALSRIPMGPNGRNWEAAKPVDAAAAKVAEYNGDYDAAAGFAQRMVDNLSDEMERLTNAPLTAEDPTNADSVAAAENERAEQLAFMAEKAAFWQDVVDNINAAKAEVQSAAAENSTSPIAEVETEADPEVETEAGQTSASMPVLEDGNPDFVSAGVERTAQFLADELGDDAVDFVRDNIAEAQRMLEEASTKKATSTNFTQRKQEATAIAEERKAAQARLDFWNTVAESYSAPQATAVKDATSPSYSLSDEIDENGRPFVKTSEGNIEFGFVESESGLTPAPILLSEGIITNPKTNDGYGLVHIEARHGDQIRAAGYNSVIDFIEEVAKEYTVIREGKKREGQQTYLLQLTDKHNNTLMVELSSDGNYWNINTAGIFKMSYGMNGKVVYNRYATAKQTAESVEASQESEQSGSTETPSINTPASPSENKDTTTTPENQISEQEVAENSGIEENTEENANFVEDTTGTTEEVTVEMVENSDLDETIKLGAIDYLNGNVNVATQLAYEIAKEYVRNNPQERAADSTDAERAQLGEGTDDAGILAGEQSRGDSRELDTQENGGIVSDSNGVRSEVSQDDLAEPSGSRGYTEMGSTESQSDDVSDTGTDGGLRGRDGGEQGTSVRTTRGGKRSGDGLPEQNEGRRGKTRRAKDSGDSDTRSVGEKKADDLIAEGLQELKDILANPMGEAKGTLLDATSLIGMFGINAVKIMGASAKIGIGLIQKGYYKFKRWGAMMHQQLDDIFHNYTQLTDELIDEFINAMWDYPFKFRGEVRKISEWASLLEAEELRAMMRMSLEEKRKLQKEAEDEPTILGDIDNIRKSLPFLLPAQQEDVEKAEMQFFDESHKDAAYGYGKGYMFTNGTGTGKTYTGLGIIKRFIKQGKGRILIVTASGEKIDDWVRDAKNLGITATRLEDTKSKGTGVVVTQFANLRQNLALLQDEFDLVVYDESHKLMENQSGIDTKAAEVHYMVTNRDAEQAILRTLQDHPYWVEPRGLEVEYKEIDALLKANKLTSEQLKRAEELGGREIMTQRLAQIDARLKELIKLQEAEVQKRMQDPAIKAAADAAVARTKTVFLSATPFNTALNLDYVEGYIFSYPAQDGAQRDREKDRERFLMDKFPSSHQRGKNGGVSRIPEGNIKDPEAVTAEEIAFSDYLQDSLHTMSGRALDSEWDYSREFPQLNVPGARLVNEAISALRGKYAALRPFFKHLLEDYAQSTAFFEVIKTSASIERIKEHIALGRKVVVFHRRMSSQEPLEPPFEKGLYAAGSDDSVPQGLIEAFKRDFAELLRWEQTLDYRFPQDILLEAFATSEEKAEFEKEQNEYGEKLMRFSLGIDKRKPKEPKLKSARVGIFNGRESEADKHRAVERFNTDGSECSLLVVQVAAGKEGISLHDKTGKHQRVMMSMQLPESPIEFVQAEGRIYRVGNQSNAIFEYPMLGIDQEVIGFAAKINGRAATTENLALGSHARGLRNSISRAVLASREIPVTPTQGVGGKQLDSRAEQDKTDYDEAIAEYNAMSAQRTTTDFNEQDTPEPIGFKMMEWARAEAGESLLEPAAGSGVMAQYAPTKSRLTAIESISHKFAILITKIGGSGRKLLNDTFMGFDKRNKFDCIVMNSPHTGAPAVNAPIAPNGVPQKEFEFLDKAFGHINEGGRIVALLTDKSADATINAITSMGRNRVVVGEVKLPAFAFPNEEGGTATRVVVFDVVSSEALRNTMPAKVMFDLSNQPNAQALFEALRSVQMPERTIDKVAILGKKLQKFEGKFKDFKNLISKSKNYRTGKMESEITFDPERAYLWVKTSHGGKYRIGVGGYYFNLRISGEAIVNGDMDEIRRLCDTHQSIQRILDAQTDLDFRRLTLNYSPETYDEIREFLKVCQDAIRAALGKTDSQIKNIAEGRVENELRGELTFKQMKDAFTGLSHGDVTLEDLSKKVFEAVGKIDGLRFYTKTGMEPRTVAYYDPNENSIVINEDTWNSLRFPDGFKAQTVVHEMIHAVTSYYLRQFEMGVPLSAEISKACSDINEVYQAITADDSFRNALRLNSKIGDNAEYGLTSATEMIAELANPVFRAQLKLKKLWRQLIEGIQRLLGINLKPESAVETTALEVLEKALDTLMSNFDSETYAQYVGLARNSSSPMEFVDYTIRTSEPPTKTGIGYKVFVLKDGKLYPPKVANPNGEDTPVGVWLDADEGERAEDSKTGRPQVKSGGKGTDGGSGKLAYRPGWHLGEIPYALQFNRNDESGERTLFPSNFVWAEVEYANDVDYQEEAMNYGYNKNGKFQHSYAGLPRVPENGSYKYRTNPNPKTDPWIITGAMRVRRLLTPTEVDEMVIAAGREPQARQQGAITDADIKALNEQLGLEPIKAPVVMLTPEEIDLIVTAMKANAEVARYIELTPENWDLEFGPDSHIDTPLGKVKIGPNQYSKLINTNRVGDFGLVKPTLMSPDIVLEEYDPEDGALRDTKYLFIKTFIKPDGAQVIYFTSVTVQKETSEVSISSHRIKSESKLKEKMHNDNVLHLNETLLGSEWRLTEPTYEGSDLVPTPSAVFSDKDNTDILDTQDNLDFIRYHAKADPKPQQSVAAQSETLTVAEKEVSLANNKEAGSNQPTPEFVRYRLSKNTRTTIRGWLNKRADLSEDIKETVLDILDQYTDTSLQLAMGKWFAQNVIRLPEDIEKCMQAVASAKKAKVDPLRFPSPMEILDLYEVITPKTKPIDPNTVPTLKKVREFSNGIAVYDVEESEESRHNMREIINTHFGKNCSPWCLLQGDENGNLTEQSAKMWSHYSAYRKQVAFKDGRLIAFNANSEPKKRWWSRMDVSYTGIPYDTKMPNDVYKRQATYIYNPVTGKISTPKDIRLAINTKDEKILIKWRSTRLSDVVSYCKTTSAGNEFLELPTLGFVRAINPYSFADAKLGDKEIRFDAFGKLEFYYDGDLSILSIGDGLSVRSGKVRIEIKRGKLAGKSEDITGEEYKLYNRAKDILQNRHRIFDYMASELSSRIERVLGHSSPNARFSLHKPTQFKDSYGQFSESQQSLAAQAETLSTAEIEEYAKSLAEVAPEGVRVVVTNSTESGDSEHAGWYDMSTDTVYINADMCVNRADVDATFIHEIVGHRSMPSAIRRLIGSRNASDRNALYTQILGLLPEEYKSQVADKVVAGMDLGEAVDEVLAEAVENEGIIEPSVWKKICAAVRALWRKIFNRNLAMSDNDIKYMFWLAAHNLDNPAEFTASEQVRNRLRKKPVTITSRVSTDEQREFDEKSLSLSADIAEAWVDSLKPLEKLQEVVAKHHGELRSWENAYDIELSRASRTMVRAQMMSERFLKPVLNAVSAFTNNGDTLEEVTYYMMAKHGLERNEYFRRKELRKLNDTINAFIQEVATNETYKELSATERVAIIKKQFADYSSYLNTKEIEEALEWYERNSEPYMGAAFPDIEAIPLEDNAGLTGLMKLLDPEAEDFTEFAENLVEEFEGKSINAVDTLWEAVRNLNNATLAYQVEGGIITRELYAHLRSMYMHYIPLRGWGGEDSSAFYEYTKPIPRQQTVVQKTKGRKSLADDPLATMANMMESAITLVEKNASKQALARMAMNRPESSLIKVVRLRYEKTTNSEGKTEWNVVYPELPAHTDTEGKKIDPSAEEIDAAIEAYNEATKKMVKEGTARTRRSQIEVGVRVLPRNKSDHYVTAMFGGEEVAVVISGNPAAARALNGTSAPSYDQDLQRTLGWATRQYAKAHTTWSPRFILTNLIRDWGYGTFASLVKHSGRYARRFQANLWRAGWNLPKLLANGTSKLTAEQYDDFSRIDKPLVRYFAEFLANGGETGFSRSQSTEQWKKEIAKQLDELQGSNPKKVIRAIGNLLPSANRWAEDIPRFAAYLTSREMGKNVAESIKDAKEITVNFSRHGSGRYGNSLVRSSYAFVNASIQGSYNFFVKLAKEHPKRFWPAIGTVFMSGFALPFLNGFLLSLFGDDDDIRNYKYMSQFNKTNRLVLFNPFGKKKGFITLPIAHELIPFYALGNIAYRRIGNIWWNADDPQDTDISVAQEVAGALLTAVPLDFISDSSKGISIRSLAISLLQPVVDISDNSDFQGRPIYKSYDFGNGNTNRWDAAFTKAPIETWDWLVELSRQTSMATGGDGLIKPGAADFHISDGRADVQLNNPAIAQYLLESYLGGSVQEATRVGNLVKGVIARKRGDENAAEQYLASYNIPIISGLYKSSTERTADSRINGIYKTYKDEIAKQCEREYRAYMEALPEDMDKWAAYAQKALSSEEYKIYKLYENVDKTIRDTEKMLWAAQKANASKSLIDALREKIRNLKLAVIEEASDIRLRAGASSLTDNN